MMKMSEHGLKLLAEWEGVIPRMYKDSAGLPTIGVGHLLTKSELSSGKIVILGAEVAWKNQELTGGQCYSLLAQDVRGAEDAVEECITVLLSQCQFDALVSFTFNSGAGALRGSTLRKVLNAGRYDEVPTQLRRWIHCGGKVVKGLANRRENEVALWDGRI